VAPSRGPTPPTWVTGNATRRTLPHPDCAGLVSHTIERAHPAGSPCTLLIGLSWLFSPRDRLPCTGSRRRQPRDQRRCLLRAYSTSWAARTRRSQIHRIHGPASAPTAAQVCARDLPADPAGLHRQRGRCVWPRVTCRSRFTRSRSLPRGSPLRRCAGKFWEYREALFRAQSGSAPEPYDDLARRFDLDLATFDGCRKDRPAGGQRPRGPRACKGPRMALRRHS